MTGFLARARYGLSQASLAGVILLSGQVGCEQPCALAQTWDRASLELSAGHAWPGEPYPSHDVPYADYYYSPCYPFASCGALLQYRMLERRRERFEALRKESERESPEVGIETRGGWPENYQRRTTAPRTAEAEIQPDYRASSQARPEYGDTGEFLPEFVERREREPR